MGMGGNTAGGGMGDVWFQFPHPELIPPYEKLDHACHILETSGHWALDVLPGFISQSKALVLVLSKYSARSEQIDLEFSSYPARRPIWVMPIGGEPIPEKWASRPNLRAVESPIEIDLEGMLETAKARAIEAEKEGRDKDAYLFYWDAINLLGLARPKDLGLLANLSALKACCEIRLGLGRGAVQSLNAGIRAAEAMGGQEVFKRLAEEELTGPLIVLGDQPATAHIARMLIDLGRAHMFARDERVADSAASPYALPLSAWEEAMHSPRTEVDCLSEEDRKQHLLEARECWKKCLRILDLESDVLSRLHRFPYNEARQDCERFLEMSAKEL